MQISTPPVGVASREFVLNTGYGFADYLLYIDGKAAGVIEAKKEVTTLTGVDVQSDRYVQGLPASLQAGYCPCPSATNPPRLRPTLSKLFTVSSKSLTKA